MLVLFETAGGYAIFKVSKPSKLEEVENIAQEFETPEKSRKFVKLVAFQKFKDTTQAVKSVSEFLEGQMPKDLKTFLKKNVISSEVTDKLLCYHKKTAEMIQSKFNIDCIHNSQYMELFRGIRSQIANLLTGISESDLKNLSVGLSHNLYRHKLKFSADKVDVMVIQAVGLLDDLDKELNNYSMRLREWYGWHFPECVKIVSDNFSFAKVVKEIGIKTNAQNVNLADLVDEDIENQIKESAIISMGSEISAIDESNMRELCDQIIALFEYREHLVTYLRKRMETIAPNLTVLVGELVAARLISHAGSLINLAKQPASTIQIFGAEKALFRALKTRHDTPKYGLIYHASMVGQAAPKLKGKISRSLAAKCALCIRVDALGENADGKIGMANKTTLEARVQQMEKRILGITSEKKPGQGKNIEKYSSVQAKQSGVYNQDTDMQLTSLKEKQRKESEQEETLTKKKKQRQVEAKSDSDSDSEEPAPKKTKKKSADLTAKAKKKSIGSEQESEQPPKKSKKKAQVQEDSDEDSIPIISKKKKKAKVVDSDSD